MSEEGGDDTIPRPKRRIKKVIIMSSSSESESDDNVGVAGSRRKKLRIISDEEDNDSSGSSIVCSSARRSRKLPKVKDSEEESDSSGWATDRSDATKPTTSTKAKATSGFSSDSSEGNSDKCSICLLRFTNQEVGTPESCEHIFCLDCIIEWSKNVNTCPVDRMTFNSIVVKACAGGRVLRTQPVTVVERRPSVDLFVVEDPTVCEICGSTDGEESMLLCDSCDLGYHMQCLTPPLSEVPPDQWLCPHCYTDILDDDDEIDMSEVQGLFQDILDRNTPLGPRPSPLREPRNVRRSSRNSNLSEQPSTSTGRQSNINNLNELPITSSSSRRTQRNISHNTTRRRTTKNRKYKRRRTKTVVIEYEVQENGKFPLTRKVTRKLKKRRVKKRQPRTAARRSHVRASVRARLATLKTDQRQDAAQVATAAIGVQELSVQRQRAGILPLRLFGNHNELDYFSDEDDAISEEASTAVAVRPTANVFSAYRQARRKMVTIPSPPHASSAPDILSNILENQTLLHSKNSIMSISVDGNVNIKLQTGKQKKNAPDNKKENIDLSKVNATVKNVPSYPGQNRGSGGWGGGYRGTYNREQTSNFNRGGNYDSNYSGGGGYQNRQGNHNYPNNSNMRREDTEYYDNFPRRPQQYSHNDDSVFDRSRRPASDNNRGTAMFPNHHQRLNDQNQSRYSLGSTWQPYNSGGASLSRQEHPPAQSRHSFGGFENPVDMRMGQMQPISTNTDSFSGIEAPRQEKPQPQSYQSLPEPQAYQALTEPPVFNFPKISEVEKSEDERSDSGLVIDTEKYDPTEPTHDDDSGDDDTPPETAVSTADAVDTPADADPPPIPSPPPPPAIQSLLAGIDVSTMNVPPNILDTAVRQVLKEHRNLIVAPSVDSHNDRSDDDSDGDCPNFSIYSATSVHIANNSSSLTDEVPKEQAEDSLEDLVQEDDETPPSKSPIVQESEVKPNNDKTPTKSQYYTFDYNEKKKSEEEYKEKVSKRCPITTNKRNPIKIKLNTPSLIKRQVSLYDDEETSEEGEAGDKSDAAADAEDNKAVAEDTTTITNVPNEIENKFNPLHSDSKCDESFSPDKQDLIDKNDADLEEKEPSPEHVNEIVADILEIEKKDEHESENGEDKFILEKEEENNNDSLENDSKVDDSIPDNTDNLSEQELCLDPQSPKTDGDPEKEDNVEKLTESISETEDERSYTPCLDENKSTKDASFETEKDKGLEGLDTEMISEDEGNEMFSENDRPPSETFQASLSPLPPAAPVDGEEGEIPDKKKEGKKASEGGKKKKKKDSKKEGKEKTKNKKKGEISFKKLSKSGKERNYREREKEDKKTERERRDSGDAAGSRQRRRTEKRKDLERYDVRTVVTEKRRKQKDPFGRDVSPRGRSPSLSPPLRSPSLTRRRSTPSRGRRSLSRARRSLSKSRRSSSRNRRSLSRNRRSLSRNRRSLSRTRLSPARIRRSISRIRRSLSGFRGSPSRVRRSISKSRRSPSLPRRSPSRGRKSPVGRRSISRRGSPARGRSPSPLRARRSPPRRSGTPQTSPRRRSAPRRKRRRSASRASRAARSPPRRAPKKKKRLRPERRAPLPSPERKRRRSASRPVEPEPASRPPSPRTPPPEPEPEADRRRRRDPERQRRRVRDLVGPSKEVFTSGDNILVSVSFKEQERGAVSERRRRREARRERRRRRRANAAPEDCPKPVAIIDLERSPFRELTPSPKNVIVLSDSEPGEREGPEPPPAPAAPEPAPEPLVPALGPKTPPEPAAPEPAAASPGPAEASGARASGPPSPDAYDPFEPTRSPSASPGAGEAGAASPPRPHMTLETAQRSNLSADEVLDRRPLTPVEKVMALLQSTRDAEAEGEAPEPAPPPPPRIVLPSPTRAAPKLFPGKPSPIKSNPVKPMQAARLARVPSDAGASPYSPGSSDFGELFEPPPRRTRPSYRPSGRLPARSDRKRGKTQVGVKIDDDDLKILDELPSSAVELQVKSKFLKKLNRQERVVEEVKLVLKPHYNKKRVTKDEYKDILRRAVPKICHNKSGEINPTKIQALVEAYVKKFRKKHKLGVA